MKIVKVDKKIKEERTKTANILRQLADDLENGKITDSYFLGLTSDRQVISLRPTSVNRLEQFIGTAISDLVDSVVKANINNYVEYVDQ